MKTGILTFHDTTNFGSLLQTYALYLALNNKNIDCEIINYQCASIKKREMPLENSAQKSLKDKVKFLLFNKYDRRKHNAFIDFMQKNMVLSEEYNRNTVSGANEKYDAFIIGSDIVWGMDVTDGDLTYFLDFAEDEKLKFSYASSTDANYNMQVQEMIVPLLKRFELISVREKKSADRISEMLKDRQIATVCDPTMLISDKKWMQIADMSDKKSSLEKRKYILLYFMDNEKKMLRDALRLKEQMRCEIVYINYRRPIIGVKNVPIYKVEDFLCYIKNADIVLSGSYHGALFAMYFKREFYFYIRAHSERMDTIAQKLGVEERKADQGVMNSRKKVNYDIVTQKIYDYRRQSQEYLDQIVGFMGIE